LNRTEQTTELRISRDLRYVFVNRALAELVGHRPEEAVGTPVIELVGKQPFETIRPYVEKVLLGERVEYKTEIPDQRAGPRFMHVTSFLKGMSKEQWWAGSPDPRPRARAWTAAARTAG
jgi:PAS domain S-box-containing protein